MEIIDLYDNYRSPTGETMIRGNKVPTGRYRFVVHICIFNSDGQMLIQQRQSNTRSWPSMWDVSVGGGVSAGETPQLAASREIREELGLSHDFSQAVPAVSISFAEGFDDYFIVHRDVRPEELHLQPEEVHAVRWATQQEILAMIDEGIFIPLRKSFVDFLFFLLTHSGTRDI